MSPDEKELFLRILSRRLLEEKQANSSPSVGDGEYLRSLSDSTGRIGEGELEEREGWGERRSISLGEAAAGEEKTGGCLDKITDQASPNPSLEQECLGEPFSSLSSLSNFLKRREVVREEKERVKEEEERIKEEERSKQLSIEAPARDSRECTRQLGRSPQQVFTIQISHN